MTCTKCHTSGKLITFATFEYWYCDKCKTEIQLESSTYNKSEEIELVEEFERLIYGSSD